MSSIEQLKSEAAALEAKARAQGHPVKHCDALEQIARNHGYDSWRACRAILGDPASAISTPLSEKPSINAIEMKHYNSKEWNFALDIPARWNTFPAVPTKVSEILFKLKLPSDHLWCLHSTLTGLTTNSALGVFAITSYFMAHSRT
jgi:hypothetical protein